MAHFIAGYHYRNKDKLVTTITTELDQFPDAEKIDQAKLLLGRLTQTGLGPCPPKTMYQTFDDEDNATQIWESYGHSCSWTVTCISKV
jgi:hypothetical protein